MQKNPFYSFHHFAFFAVYLLNIKFKVNFMKIFQFIIPLIILMYEWLLIYNYLFEAKLFSNLKRVSNFELIVQRKFLKQ